MTATEKAKELVEKFFQAAPEYRVTLESSQNREPSFWRAKRYALIAVDEIIEVVKVCESIDGNFYTDQKGSRNYWQEVKEAINSL